MEDVVVARPVLDGARESRHAFEGFVRQGLTVEMKAFTGVTGDAGGFAVPKEIDGTIDALLKSVSPIRRLANVVRVGSSGYRKLVTAGGTPSGWAAETQARPETATPQFNEIAPPMGELYANPAASQAMLDDAAFDVEEWLAGEIAAEFARAEGAAFVNGSGVNRPKGFLTYPTSASADAARAFGTLQHLPTGSAGDLGANVAERLIDLVHALRAPYRQGAAFVMNAATAARIRKLRTTDGAFLWQPSMQAGTPATLLGYGTSRDFRGCRLSFRWRSAGVKPLDAVNGPTLTIEGRDAGGNARAWYVRLWNYATGTPDDAVVAIDFAGVDGGFLLPGEADPVWAGDVDRMFVSMAPPAYDGADAPLGAPVEGWVELTAMRCEGPGSVLAVALAARGGVAAGGIAMATVVLTALGGAVAGPVGAAIGAAAGGAIDARLFAPKSREGPRLSELRVQMSSYGTQVPRLFGTMRVAGTVFWATDLVERRENEGGGKGRPGSVRYSYLANLAVLLSARPILRVGRVWADGRLVRGAAGDWKVRTGFRVHLGGEDQAADPLIASAEGPGAPAARGCAYAVFEGLELAEFGERIPSFTFEVVADEEPVGVDAIARELAGEVEADCALKLDGFAAAGGSVRGVLDALARAAGAAVGPGPRGLAMRDAPARVVELADAGVRADRGAGSARALAAAEGAPRLVTVAHYDPARDWQLGVQRAGSPGGRTEAVELPAALGADAAKALAGAMLARGEAARVRRTVRPGLGALAVRPGDGVRVAGEAGLWCARSVECERWAVAVELEPVAPEPLAAPAGAGRVLPAPDRVVGATRVELFELPDMGDATGPRLHVAACGGPGWRGASLLLSFDGGASWTPAGATAAPSVMGVVEVPPVAAAAGLVDGRSGVVVRLAEHMTLGDADDAALGAGANLALLGDELVQFGRAEPLGGGRWRLGGLLRGRYGTEGAGPAAAGARFVLLEEDAIRAVALPPEAIGREVRLLASGAGDADGPAEARTAPTGRSALPLAPVHFRVAELADGGARVTWVRRSRRGWRWIDGTDAPLGEEREAWAVEVAGGRTAELDSASFVVPAAERGTDVELLVRQRGDWGVGAAARVVVRAR